MKTLSQARALLSACALAAAFGISACSSADLAGNDLQAVSLSFTSGTRSGAAALNATVSSLSSTPAVLPSVAKVQLVLTRMELARTDDITCVDDNDDDDSIEHSSSTESVGGHDCEHVTRDPVLIDMPVDGTLRTQLNVPLAAGTYRKLEAKLAPVNGETSAGAAFLVSHPGFAGTSLRVDGTFNGAPFTFKTGLHAGIHMRFNPALVIDATTKNATITVDVSKWFVTMHGDVINPALAMPGTPAARIIESNIRTSFHAFEDNARKGNDDGEGHGSGHR